jgi:hypothetical protein
MSLQIRLAQDNPGAWPVRESDHGMPVAVVPSNLGAVPVRISSNIGSVPVRVMSGELSPDTPVDPVVPVPDILWWKFTEGSELGHGKKRQRVCAGFQRGEQREHVNYGHIRDEHDHYLRVVLVYC